MGAARDIYADGFGGKLPSLDEFLSRFEPHGQEAIGFLLARKEERDAWIDGKWWIGSLLPFVAQLFTRGIDFQRRVEFRANVMGVRPPNQAELGLTRVAEYTLVAGALARCQWLVLWSADGENFVTNDVGRVRFLDLRALASGWGVPLRRDAVLILMPDRHEGMRLWRQGNRLVAGPVRHHIARPGIAGALNEKIALFANTEIYGSDQTEVARLQPFMGEAPPPELVLEPASIMGTAVERVDAAAKSYDRICGPLDIEPSTYPLVTGSDDAFPICDLKLSTTIASFQSAWTSTA